MNGEMGKKTRLKKEKQQQQRSPENISTKRQQQQQQQQQEQQHSTKCAQGHNALHDRRILGREGRRRRPFSSIF
jgi:hypothetical protein